MAEPMSALGESNPVYLALTTTQIPQLYSGCNLGSSTIVHLHPGYSWG